MAVSEARDNTEDWVLPEAARPRSFAELESRVELALTVAHASEAAIAEVGAAAIEAAEQARQAAGLAERAAIAAQQARDSVPVAVATAEPVAVADSAIVAEPAPEPASPVAENPALYPLPPDEDLRLAHFMDRAARVVERLQALQQV